MGLVEGRRVGAQALCELKEGLRIGIEYILAAPAKVNLRLKVLGRRADGYHLLSMLNASTSLADEVRVTLSPVSDAPFDVSVISEPAAAVPGNALDNSVARAWSSFWGEFSEDGAPCGVSVVIIKRIPVGGGLGGGSSDAAAMLRFLAQTCADRLCQLLSITAAEFDKRMMKTALAIGADVPYSYRGGLCWVTGIGEQVTPLPDIAAWPGDVLITVPPVSVPTGDFYRFFRQLHPQLPETSDPVMERISEGGVPISHSELLANDFESDVVVFRPGVAEALRLARKYYPHTTSLTGSGSAIFSLVPEQLVSSVSAFIADMAARGVLVHRAKMLQRAQMFTEDVCGVLAKRL